MGPGAWDDPGGGFFGNGDLVGGGGVSFLERLRHDAESGAHFDGAIRYMFIRPDALMGIFARLEPGARADALAALGDSIREQGGHSAASYVAREGVEHLLSVIEATAPELGWGIWRFHEDASGALRLTVTNSPFAAAARFEGPVCHAIAGMAGAVGGLAKGGDCVCREVACAASGAAACEFVIEPAGGEAR